MTNDSYQLARQILRSLEINNPTDKQIYVIESLMPNLSIHSYKIFDLNLSSREQCCLFWSANGKNSRQAADIMNVKINTVRGYKKDILRKLDCLNMTQAVFYAMRCGYLIDKKFD